jgi:hypothetical protein
MTLKNHIFTNLQMQAKVKREVETKIPLQRVFFPTIVNYFGKKKKLHPQFLGSA